MNIMRQFGVAHEILQILFISDDIGRLDYIACCRGCIATVKNQRYFRYVDSGTDPYCAPCAALFTQDEPLLITPGRCVVKLGVDVKYVVNV